MTYLPDPGQVFASDVHRRVLAHLAVPGAEDNEPLEVSPLIQRLNPDGANPFFTEADAKDLEEVLKDLEADGYASGKGGWHMTKKGFEAITGPVGGEI